MSEVSEEKMIESELRAKEIKKIINTKYEWFEKVFNEIRYNNKIVTVRIKEGISIFADRYEIDTANGISQTVTLFRKDSIITVVPIQLIEEVK
jgi:hypothetical protein